MTETTETAYRAVNFIETFTGKPFYSLAPRVEDVSVIDIAHALSNQCRYSGHCEVFYSTAQHCCLLTDYVLKRGGTAKDGLQILLHDGAEAYLVDIPRPVKQFMPEYRAWDHRVTMCIREWAGLGADPIPTWQDEYDSRIICDERAQLFVNHELDWQHPATPLGIRIEPWHSRYAEQEFLKRYAALSNNVHGTWQYLRSGWGVPTNAKFLPWRTEGGDVPQAGAPEPRVITDLIEVDLRGGVGRVALRSPDGMLIRDTSAGRFPRPAWAFIHGKFELTMQGSDHGLGAN